MKTFLLRLQHHSVTRISPAEVGTQKVEVESLSNSSIGHHPKTPSNPSSWMPQRQGWGPSSDSGLEKKHPVPPSGILLQEVVPHRVKLEHRQHGSPRCEVGTGRIPSLAGGSTSPIYVY